MGIVGTVANHINKVWLTEKQTSVRASYKWNIFFLIASQDYKGQQNQKQKTTQFHHFDKAIRFDSTIVRIGILQPQNFIPSKQADSFSFRCFLFDIIL